MNTPKRLWWGRTRTGLLAHLYPDQAPGTPALCRSGGRRRELYSVLPAACDRASGGHVLLFPPGYDVCPNCDQAASAGGPAEGGAA